MTRDYDGPAAPIPIELMRRIWANLYFNEAEAGNTFQATLNDVVDWLKKHDALARCDRLVPEYTDEQFAAVQREAAEDDLLAAGTHYLDANGALQLKPSR